MNDISGPEAEPASRTPDAERGRWFEPKSVHGPPQVRSHTLPEHSSHGVRWRWEVAPRVRGAESRV